MGCQSSAKIVNLFWKINSENILFIIHCMIRAFFRVSYFFKSTVLSFDALETCIWLKFSVYFIKSRCQRSLWLRWPVTHISQPSNLCMNGFFLMWTLHCFCMLYGRFQIDRFNIGPNPLTLTHPPIVQQVANLGLFKRRKRSGKKWCENSIFKSTVHWTFSDILHLPY